MSNNYKILVIDDDTRLRVLLGRFLEENGFLVLLAKDTNEAKLQMEINQFDLLIVDVMMPNQNGLEFTRNLRVKSNIPVIMLTARGEQDDRIKGLEVGADDYLPKPFEPKELLLRINNILKRISPNKITFEKNDQPNICKFGEFVFNFQDFRLTKDQNFIHLTESEAKILKILCQEQGKAVTRESLSKLCGEIDDRSIDVQITRIRRKIEINPKKPQFLQTVRNHGYILYN